MKLVRNYLALLLLLVFVIVISVHGQQTKNRTFSVDDMLQLESLGDKFVYSPDGKMLAYVVQRPKSADKYHLHPFLQGDDRADIWLMNTGNEPYNLTKGLEDHTGWWAPNWSPTGKYLSMFSTRGNNKHLWVWNRDKDTLQKVSENGIDISESFIHETHRWVSDTELLYETLPAGEKSIKTHMLYETPDTATEEWAKARRGEEATASILESGTELAVPTKKKLVISNVATGERRVLHEGNTNKVIPSPDKSYLAALVQVGVFQPTADQPIQHSRINRNPLCLKLFKLNKDGDSLVREFTEIKEILSGSVKWSPDNAKVVFAGKHTSASTNKNQVFVYNVRSDDFYPLSMPDLKLFRKPVYGVESMGSPNIKWISDNRVVIQGSKAGSSRNDWWLLERSAKPVNVTSSMKAPPRELFSIEGEPSLVGLSKGKLWKIPTDPTKDSEIISGEQISNISKITRADGKVEKDGVEQLVIKSGDKPTQTKQYLFNLKTHDIKQISKPKKEATLETVSMQPRRAIFSLSDNTGTYAWHSRKEFEDYQLFQESNTFLNNINRGKTKSIKYVSQEGDSLNGWVLLPPDYKKEKKYPMVTWVYAGKMQSPVSPPIFETEINRSTALNLQLLAAKGYAVLFPSMPLSPIGEESNPYMELPKGVLPAVDKAVDLGIADPERVAVMGQSYGGYSTYGLITQTDRFKAAVSLAGLSNLISMYGQLDARIRYDEGAHRGFLGLNPKSIAETGQLRMGSPPWEDLQRYIRNSPLFYAERVETPLLIIQGDLDFVPIQQGEEFFSALYRQGKRARFVRYWGEGHVLTSPQNIKHMWNQIFDWLDSHLDEEGN